MDNTIKRGTTPSIILDFSDLTDKFVVADIDKLSLHIYSRAKDRVFTLNDMTVGENELSYHFSEEETLAFAKGENLKFDGDILLKNGERYGLDGFPKSLEILDTKTNEVMHG